MIKVMCGVPVSVGDQWDTCGREATQYYYDLHFGLSYHARCEFHESVKPITYYPITKEEFIVGRIMND
jgi:hypothetical protein